MGCDGILHRGSGAGQMTLTEYQRIHTFLLWLRAELRDAQKRMRTAKLYETQHQCKGRVAALEKAIRRAEKL